MNTYVILIVVVLGLLFLIGSIAIVALKLGVLKPNPPQTTAAPDEPNTGPSPRGYRIRDSVLTPTERECYAALQNAVRLAFPAAPPFVFASVRLAEVLSVDSPKAADRSAWQTAFNRIASKQVDFVLADAATTRPIMVVELDDRTHSRTDRRQRDEFVDRACAAAGLRVVHVPAASRYAPADLAKLLS